ncbi:hypothetical protein ZHAS_00003384 [Anopheles sinensis]|uniref:A2M_recep domain-containing protein n=1 Tax=Anopheles sinensis TaxID=74873 RepID=A0A084VE73_ANOSI|nr:hypothetical protein ZHAS_00003384 [Anopheles sinensis]
MRNVLILDYLNAIGSKNTDMINALTNIVRKDYQTYLKTTQTSVFQTASVINTMRIVSKYISKQNDELLAEAFAWLASRQQQSGQFDEDEKFSKNSLPGGLRNGISLTSYVLIALLENKSAVKLHASVITKALNYVFDQLPQVTELYDLAIATYATLLSNNHSKYYILYKLISRSSNAQNGSTQYWDSGPDSIETTSYALLAMVQAGKYLNAIPVMRWLANQYDGIGNIAPTQGAFMALKALTKLVTIISPLRNNYNIELMYEKEKKSIPITSPDLNKLSFDIPSTVRDLGINVTGVGFGVFDVKYEYTQDLRNFIHRFNLTLEKLNTTSNYELKLKICASFIPKYSLERSNQALVEVNFPSGYIVDRSLITDATNVNPYQAKEIRFGGTSVVVFYENMGTEKNCFHTTAHRRFKADLKRPAYVLVYDKNDPKLNAIVEY